MLLVLAQHLPDPATALPHDAGTQALLLLVAFGLVLLNGFFVAAEFALVKVRGTRIRELAAQGSWRATVAARLVEHLDAYLSATQLGITFASIGLGWVGEPAVSELIKPLLGRLGVTSPTVIQGVSFAIAFGIISFFHIVLGELAPKSLAIRKAEETSLWVAPLLRFFYFLFYPAIYVLNGTANLLLRGIGIAPAGEGEEAHSGEELRMIVGASHAHGLLNATERRLLENAIDFSERRVAEIMIPRGDIVALSATKSLAENRRIMAENRYTRYPLVRRNTDDIIGMVHVKDVLRLVEEGKADAPIASIMRPILFIPETATIDQALRTFQRQKVLMAAVVDEYGITAGLLTLEDVLEELVGEIGDEFDKDEEAMRRARRPVGVLDAGAPIDVLTKRYGIRVPPDAGVHTIAGYVFKLLGRVPVVGERIAADGHIVEVVSMKGRRITGVRIRRAPPAKGPGVGGAPGARIAEGGSGGGGGGNGVRDRASAKPGQRDQDGGAAI